jgi:hypothetical protein
MPMKSCWCRRSLAAQGWLSKRRDLLTPTERTRNFKPVKHYDVVKIFVFKGIISLGGIVCLEDPNLSKMAMNRSSPRSAPVDDVIKLLSQDLF